MKSTYCVIDGRLSPNDLDVLIHYYVSHREHERIHAGAVQGAINSYLQEGIFERVPDHPRDADWTTSFQLTDKGKAWLQMILATPMPVMLWADPRKSEASHEGI